ncbi:hypothetical protein FA10DRAFT_301796 [Acaromyces ingoldii]|uniref:SH3 domain-containing protein n=1 Tax=Acaromyces ingoldii TaxID=215250 RepID=A0A316YPH3_9BASI|nr:hypothetical protein FA10DRAFT_301796 [Acaromyces ingoldii]PWN90558.1 hypothetical protein FA10DRAFT_301796 [Acaromyces ingoldii]
MMAQARPVLTVDVNIGQGGVRNQHQAAKAAAQARASAQAPQSGQDQDLHPDDMTNGNGDRGGFSSDDEEAEDTYAGAGSSGRVKAGTGQAAARNGTAYHGQEEQYMDDSESSNGEEYEPQEGDIEIVSDEDEGVYDEDDDDDLSSSPSIPDENIDFDLVYAMHNFVATVEGQATVYKGNSLTLLDDSNSYWWLVRVLRTQEVGYIPAENIETPFERLARLNKHRNVDLTSATDDDHIQVPEKIFVSHLVKQRNFGPNGGLSEHSGKLSALSMRRDGDAPEHVVREKERIGDRGVQFGPSTYLEHSGNEDSEDEYDDDENPDMEGDEDMDEEYDEDDENEEEQEEQGGESQGDRGEEIIRSRRGVEEGIGAGATATAAGAAAGIYAREHAQGNERTPMQQAQQQQQQHPQPGQQQQYQSQQPTQQQQGTSRRGYLDKMEPDDGMDWDAAETERVQRAQQERIASKQAADVRRSNEDARSQGVQQRNSANIDSAPPSTLRPGGNIATQRASNERLSMTGSDRNSQGFLPSAVLASRDRSASDASVGSSQLSPESKKDKKAAQRRSKTEEDVNEEKAGKKRSGVFSGLFSRSKDKKERKSGSFGSSHNRNGSSGDGDSLFTGRSSEESLGNTRRISQSSNPGRTVQERDRAQQEAYQRQFLTTSGTNPEGDYRHLSAQQHGRVARPGSLIGPSGTVPMLNVLRIFAGDNIDSDATFKTVLLNDSTTSKDLVKQAVQRFRLGAGQDPAEYMLTVKLVEGDERQLDGDERPLQVFDKYSEDLANDRDTPTVPSVKRSSVGSISSISSNLSLNPAIARLGNDFSDDHAVKFYLHKRKLESLSNLSSVDQSYSLEASTLSAGNTSSDTQQRASQASMLSADTADTIQASSARFALRLLIFPSDLPEGTVFDPQTSALIPQRTLVERGPGGMTPGEGITQEYREKVLVLPRNATVAEVIEQGLDRFGIMEGVVEGGDDVEDRSSRRRSKAKVRYGLSVDINHAERSLNASGKVVDAFPVAPVFKSGAGNRRSLDAKRRSIDSMMLLSVADDIRPDDPIFILRQVHPNAKNKTARSLSPTEDVLINKQDQRRQAELDKVAPMLSQQRSPSTANDLSVLGGEKEGMSRQEIIAAQRAAARERRAAVLGAERNEDQGVDLLLEDRTRIRSSRSLESGKVRYSYIGSSGQEQDISNIVEDVLQDHQEPKVSRPPNARMPSRAESGLTADSFESAPSPSLMDRRSPLSLNEVHYDVRVPAQTGDLLETFVRNPKNAETTIEDRIDQVLARVTAGTISPFTAGYDDSGRATPTADGRSSSRAINKTGMPGSLSSHDSPTSNTTHQTSISTMMTTTTPLSLMSGTAAAAAAAAAASGGGTRSVTSPRNNAPLRGDFGLSNLYTLVDAAARRGAKGHHRGKSSSKGGSNGSGGGLGYNGPYKPSVGGLFPPQSPHIGERRVKEVYAPIGRQLNNIEESLDQLLNDALRNF